MKLLVKESRKEPWQAKDYPGLTSWKTMTTPARFSPFNIVVDVEPDLFIAINSRSDQWVYGWIVIGDRLLDASPT